jgi:homeobox protein YOX1/YHP1
MFDMLFAVTPLITNAAAQQNSSSFYYENNEPRYNGPNSYQNFPSRASPVPSDQHNSRRLPPLSTSPPTERWPATTYPSAATFVPTMSSNIRSPTAAYPPAYAPYPNQTNTAYSYPPVPDPRNTVASMNSQSQMLQMVPAASADRVVASRNETRATSTSPYARNHSSVSPPTYAPQSVPTVSTEEPMIKKKRKRADANQLKVLNETYNRTAFPSTEERAELARKLDMSARSVQIWFQNKRQSMRQTSRQTNNAVTSNSHQQFALTAQEDSLLDEAHASVGGYGGPIASIPGSSYMAPRLPSENSRTAVMHNSMSPSISHRHPRGHESDSRKYRGSYQ